MLAEFREALFELSFAEIGNFEAPVAVGRTTADVVLHHERSVALEHDPGATFEKWPESRTNRLCISICERTAA
jgi:hypothetical protein